MSNTVVSSAVRYAFAASCLVGTLHAIEAWRKCRMTLLEHDVSCFQIGSVDLCGNSRGGQLLAQVSHLVERMSFPVSSVDRTLGARSTRS
jgi:hypothetical protein